jgi:hypothetical protein
MVTTEFMVGYCSAMSVALSAKRIRPQPPIGQSI